MRRPWTRGRWGAASRVLMMAVATSLLAAPSVARADLSMVDGPLDGRRHAIVVDNGRASTRVDEQLRTHVAEPKRARRTTSSPASLPDEIRAVQMNLCHSGTVSCFSGDKVINEAYELVLQEMPDVLTLNEICANDVNGVLYEGFRNSNPYEYTYWAFNPALDGAGTVKRCTNGQPFGNGVMGAVDASSFRDIQAWSYEYAVQDGGNERRTAVCVYAVTDHLACATHLSIVKSVAANQCQSLMDVAIPYIRAADHAYVDTVVGGDFNLKYGDGAYDVQNCVASGWTRKGDGDVQHVFFTNGLTAAGTNRLGMVWTDHPLWEVTMPPRNPNGPSPGAAWIKNANSKLCALGRLATNNSPVTQFTCLNYSDQKWYLQLVSGTNYYQIRNQDNGLCLVARTSENVAVQYNCGTYADQQWTATKQIFTSTNGLPSQAWQFQNRASGKCLLRQGTALDAQLTTYTCGSYLDQKWWVYDAA